MPSWPALSRSRQAVARPDLAGNDDLRGTGLDRRLVGLRRSVGTVLIGLFVLGPGVAAVRAGFSPTSWFLLVGSVVFFLTVVVFVVVWPTPPVWVSKWLFVAYFVGLATALFVVGQQHLGDAKQLNWVVTLAVAAAACGRFSATPRPAVVGGGACAIVGAGVTLSSGHYGSGNVAVATFLPPMAALFAYAASKRMETLTMLRQTRAELARVAVAEERLRIARDLHDLLGHSLSLITLKAELAGRVLETDTGRAGREIGELESVARQALADVRAAVSGYRQPDLAAELAAARQLLTAAGVACLISAPGAPRLAPELDAALAWTVMEAATNIVRHATAEHATFTIRASRSTAVAEITDDGNARPASAISLDSVSPAEPPAHQPVAAGNHWPPLAGSGLAGLAERVRGLGGELVAGAVSPHGFRLRVTLPFSSDGEGQAE
jgi:two-component system sensor histidine kinase DesK